MIETFFRPKEPNTITVLGRLICNFQLLAHRFYVKSNLAILGHMKLEFWSFWSFEFRLFLDKISHWNC